MAEIVTTPNAMLGKTRLIDMIKIACFNTRNNWGV
jgi:hypothetical protein